MTSVESRIAALEARSGMYESRMLVVDEGMSDKEVEAMIAADRERTGHPGNYLLIRTGVPRPRSEEPEICTAENRE